MLKNSCLLFILLLGCSCRSEMFIVSDDKIDTTYYHTTDYKKYYLSDGAHELYMGTYRQAPILHKFDFVSLIESGDKSNELYLVTTADGKIQLKDLIPQVYELRPESRPFVLFAEDVSQTPTGDIAITFYSPSEEVEFVVCVDREMKVRMLD